jgi:hypothetical protein
MSEPPPPPPLGAAVQGPAASRGLSSVKLPSFWASSPAAWFRAVEAQFVVREVASNMDKYYEMK